MEEGSAAMHGGGTTGTAIADSCSSFTCEGVRRAAAPIAEEAHDIGDQSYPETLENDRSPCSSQSSRQRQQRSPEATGSPAPYSATETRTLPTLEELLDDLAMPVVVHTNESKVAHPSPPIVESVEPAKHAAGAAGEAPEKSAAHPLKWPSATDAPPGQRSSADAIVSAAESALASMRFPSTSKPQQDAVSKRSHPLASSSEGRQVSLAPPLPDAPAYHQSLSQPSRKTTGASAKPTLPNTSVVTPATSGEGVYQTPSKARVSHAFNDIRGHSKEGDTSRSATPSKLSDRRKPVSSSYIASLLRGVLGTATVSDRAATEVATPIDLPVGLLLLYCAAEEACTWVRDDAPCQGPSPPPASAYSLLYLLEQLSEVRRRDHHLAALRRARELECARCEHLYEAAIRKRARDAAREAAHLQATAEEELAACTFHPEVSDAAKRVVSKGTRNFMERCLEWREEVNRRLRHRLEHVEEQRMKEEAAAAEQRGTIAPGTTVTEGSRRILSKPGVQERLKCRPRLWEARRRAGASPENRTSSSAPQHALPASSVPLLPGVPLTSKATEAQEAALRELCRPDTAAKSTNTSQSPNGGDSRLLKSNTSTLKEFLGRMAEDAERRGATVAKLLAQYHNPDFEKFEMTTGQQLFHPNAMPAAWKDGQRVSYESLTKEEQDHFRAELSKVGLSYVLARHLHEQQRHQQSRVGERAEPEGSEALAAEAVVALGHSSAQRSSSRCSPRFLAADSSASRFMASLAAARERSASSRARARAEATTEETFRPHISKRSVKMALHKTGGTPIYERSAKPRGTTAAAAPDKKKMRGLPSDREPDRQPSTRTDRPLSEREEQFLSRNEQWAEAHQRRLQQLMEIEAERRYADCTFTPNRESVDARRSEASPQHAAGTPSHADASSLSFGSGCAAEGDRRPSASHLLEKDMLASAADVRVLNELELLRSGAAYRDEDFVRAVCELSGARDARWAMSNLSLNSAPRLTRLHQRSMTPPSSRWRCQHNRNDHVYSSASQVQLSPIPQRSNRPSASPYSLPRRHAGEAVSRFQKGLPLSRASRSESESTQTPLRPAISESANASRYAAYSASGESSTAAARFYARDFSTDVSPIENPWAALDAQTDEILRRRGY